MNATAMNQEEMPDIQGTMKSPLAKSAMFHGVLLLVCMFGLPIFRPNIEIVAEAVPIEIATVDDMSRTNLAPARAEVEKPKPEEKPEKEPEKPRTVTNKSETPPKPVLDKPKPVEKPKPAEALDDDIADPDKKAEEKPKPPEKKPEKKPEVKPEQTDAFNSLLKNLEETKPVAGEKKIEAPQTGETPSPMATLSDRLTANEITERLRQQLTGCWNPLAGAAYAENLVVAVRIYVNPDRTVRNAQIIDQMRYNTDTYFRAAADSALSALRHPNCTPLDLPLDKSHVWQPSILFNFDPSQML